MKQKTKEVYYCDHCNRHMLNKGAMNRHELMCHLNPENFRACHLCVFLEKKDLEIEVDYYGQESTPTVNVFHCQKKGVYMHTPQNEIKGNKFELGDYSNDPMPKECDQQCLGYSGRF